MKTYRLRNGIIIDRAERDAEDAMRKHGIEFGQLSGIYTEQQMERQKRQRRELSLESLSDNINGWSVEQNMQQEQETLEFVIDTLDAGKVKGIDPSQADLLKSLIVGMTVTQLASIRKCKTSDVKEELRRVRRNIDKQYVWILLVLAEVFNMHVNAIKDLLR